MADRARNASLAEKKMLDRLRPLADLPDGIVEHRQGASGQIVVAKAGTELFLVFCPTGVPLTNDALSGVMSRIDLTQPLVLTGTYTQAMLACLAFVPEPKQVYVMGGGGGRVPTVLHALFDDVGIIGSEIDQDVLDLSQEYFGLEDGPRLRISCAEGKSHLSRQADGQFDHIYLDCFAADGRVPPSLASASSFRMCAEKLRAGGIICMNLVDSDPNFSDQRRSFLGVFTDVWGLEFDGTHVLFGCKDTTASAGSLAATARLLAAQQPLGFDLPGHVDALRRLT